jgi:two-component system, NarL family, response regulator LiaR
MPDKDWIRMEDKKRIRVLVVDDHAVVRNGIKFSLTPYPDLEFSGEAENGEKALKICQEIQPDVVLMDAKMPGMDGIAATRSIRSQFPHVQVIILTSFQEGYLVRDALQAGAIGYMLKDASIEDLVGAIRSAYVGRASLSSEAGHALVQAVVQDSEHGFDLTERELEVLSLIIDGLSNDQIAVKLAISFSTARFHVSTILAKMGAANRAEAAALAVKHRLV